MDSDSTNLIKEYEQLWDNIVNANFENEIIIISLDYVRDENENEFIDYMKRMFRRRTIDEWMDNYEREEKINQFNDLKIRELSTNKDSETFLNIKNFRYVESEKGKITLENLKSFEMKYFSVNGITKSKNATTIKARKILQEIIDLRKIIEDYKKDIRSKNRDLKELIKDVEFLEKEFDKDVPEFPKLLPKDIKSKRGRISRKKEEIFEIEKKLWGTVGKGEGLIWRHDRLYDQYKRIMLNDDELFNELKSKSIERYTNKLRQKIKVALRKHKIETDEEEMLDIITEVLSNKMEEDDRGYEEMPGEDFDEEKYDQAINTMLKNRYDIMLQANVEGDESQYYTKNFKNLQVNTEVDTNKIIFATSNNQLKSFGRGELQEALEPIAKEFKLIIGESVPQKKVRSITNKLVVQGWNANEPSVGEALRKMGYVKGRRM